MKHIFMALVLISAATSSARAGFDDGVAAYNRSNCRTVLRENLPLAQASGVEAKYVLGVMNKHDNSVAQDCGEAGESETVEYEFAPPPPSQELLRAIDEDLQKQKEIEQERERVRRDANLGDASAQNKLGLMYEYGDGVTQDYVEAVMWYGRAAEQGLAAAQYNLGDMYDNGKGVAQNYGEALKWYRLAAEQGNVSAQRSLGIMYANGRAVARDYVQAHMWYNLVAANQPPGKDRDEAARFRDDVAKRMTPAQIAQAQELARNFKPNVLMPLR